MIDPKLLKAYPDTKFIVSTRDGEITFRVGERSEDFDNLLRELRANGGAFITAWNPGSTRLVLCV
jgi:hypothetical protein